MEFDDNLHIDEELENAFDIVKLYFLRNNIEFSKELMDALIFAQLREYDSSIMLTDKVLKTDPYNATALLNKAFCLRQIGNISEALDCADLGIKFNPYSSEIVSLMCEKARCLVILEREEEAIDVYNEVLEIDPLNQDARLFFEFWFS